MSGAFQPIEKVEALKEIEASLLNGLAIREVKLDEVKALGLKAEDLVSETHRLIFMGAERLDERGDTIDAWTLGEELEKGPSRPDGGESWRQYIMSVLGVAEPIGNVSYHVQKIKEASRNRQLSEAGYRLHEAAQRGEAEAVRELSERIAELQLAVTDTEAGSRLQPIPVADLPDIEPPKSLWGGVLFPGTVTQLNAEPGVGKTTLGYSIVALGAQGKDFIGESFSGPIKTLYADLETPSWLCRPKTEAICGELPSGFDLLNDLNLSRDISELIRLCRAGHYDLVVLDTQSKVLDMEDENSNSEGNRKGKLLDRLKLETGAAVLLIHHTSKGGNGKDVYKGRGGSSIAGSVDIVCNLEALTADTVKLSVAKTRVPSSFRSITLRKLGEDKFERIDSEAGNTGVGIFRVQDFILDLLSDGAEWRTSEIIERAVREGFAARTAERAVKRLREAGKIVQIRQGMYVHGGELLNTDMENCDYPEVLT